MASDSARSLKKRLQAAGFEVFRTLGERVVLAERVRDNLIMDSGVSVVACEPPTVRVTFRAQSNDFPDESETQLFARARALGAPLQARGYAEAEQSVIPVHDPGDDTSTLDTWYEVAVTRTLPSREALESELKFVLAQEKTAS